jgi:hypothetical protein
MRKKFIVKRGMNPLCGHKEKERHALQQALFFLTRSNSNNCAVDYRITLPHSHDSNIKP